MNPPERSVQYYYYNDQQEKVGPFTPEALLVLYSAKVICGSTTVIDDQTSNQFTLQTLLDAAAAPPIAPEPAPAESQNAQDFPENPEPELNAIHYPGPDDECYAGLEGEQRGPYLPAQIKTMWANGVLTANTVVTWSRQERPLPVKMFINGPPPEPARAVQTGGPTRGARLEAPEVVPQSRIPVQSPAGSNGTETRRIETEKIRDGQFTFSGPYESIFALVEKAIKDCGATQVYEQSIEEGVIRAKFNAGFAVTASFYSEGSQTYANIEAIQLYQLDLLGGCNKKLTQISDRILSLATSLPPQPLSSHPQTAPTYKNRSSASYRSKAIVGLWYSIGGLLIVPAAVIGVIICSKVLSVTNDAPNRDGREIAIGGLFAGVIAIVSWVVYVL